MAAVCQQNNDRLQDNPMRYGRGVSKLRFPLNFMWQQSSVGNNQRHKSRQYKQLLERTNNNQHKTEREMVIGNDITGVPPLLMFVPCRIKICRGNPNMIRAGIIMYALRILRMDTIAIIITSRPRFTKYDTGNIGCGKRWVCEVQREDHMHKCHIEQNVDDDHHDPPVNNDFGMLRDGSTSSSAKKHPTTSHCTRHNQLQGWQKTQNCCGLHKALRAFRVRSFRCRQKHAITSATKNKTFATLVICCAILPLFHAT